MKTEVFMSMTPGLSGASKLHSLPKTPEDAVIILLPDTPRNTPIGTPGSDIFSGEYMSFNVCTYIYASVLFLMCF